MKKLITASRFALGLALLLAGANNAASRAQQSAAPSPQPPTASQAKETPPVGGTPKAFTLPRRETFDLKNKMRVTLVPYGAVPKVTAIAIVRAGNIDEAENQVWLADLTGQMMKEGTATRSGAQIAEEAARMGGQVNVAVGPDTSRVSGDVLSEFGPQMIALIADVMQRPALPEGELARLKADYVRQLTVAKSQPGALANEAFRKALYPNHPYGRIFPTEQMMNAYAVADVRKFYQDHFSAARTHLYVAGKFDRAEMRRAITAAFESWAPGGDAATNVPKPVGARSLRLIDRPGAAQSTLYVGLPVVNPNDADYINFQVMNALLGGSFASRITSNIREQKGYTYSPSSQISARYRDAYWVEVADVTTAVTGPSLKEIFYEIERLRKEPPPDAELQGIKNYLAGIFVLQNSSRQGVINQLAYTDLHGLPEDYLNTYVQKVLAVTPADVQQVAQKYLSSDKMTIVVVGDKAKISEQLNPYGPMSQN